MPKTTHPPVADSDDDFPPASYATWRQRVEKELGDAGFESLVARRRDGLEVEPLHTAEGPAPPPDARPPIGRRGAWRIARHHAHGSIDAAGDALAEDFELGVGEVWLHLDGGGGAPGSADGQPGEPLLGVTAHNVARLFAASRPAVTAVVLEAGTASPELADRWVAAAGAAGMAVTDLAGGFGCDPLGTLAGGGSLPVPLADAGSQLADLGARCHRAMPGMRAGLVSASPYHDAGAGAELAFAVATGLDYLRRLTAAGLDAAAAAAQLRFALSVGSEVFAEIAKLRAARLLWAKVLGACGAGGVPMLLHARTSAASWTAHEPHTNLLRATAQVAAAALGGADSIAAAPFDAALGQPVAGAASRRLAVRLQQVLAEEGHLAAVADPAAGSWSLEALTEQLARAAWGRLQELERRGGMAECLRSGVVAEQLAAAAEARS